MSTALSFFMRDLIPTYDCHVVIIADNAKNRAPQSNKKKRRSPQRSVRSVPSSTRTTPESRTNSKIFTSPQCIIDRRISRWECISPPVTNCSSDPLDHPPSRSVETSNGGASGGPLLQPVRQTSFKNLKVGKSSAQAITASRSRTEDTRGKPLLPIPLTLCLRELPY
jgi:hypothetical protein